MIDLVDLQFKSGKTQEELARICDTSLCQMGNVLRRRHIPSAVTAGILATLFGRTVQKLWPAGTKVAKK